MKKIKDRVTLGLVAGMFGTIAKTAVDEISLRKKISKRSYRETAAGVWVRKRKEASNPQGQILGTIMDLGLSSTGALGQVYLLTQSGRDHIILKGLYFGITFGAAITAILSGFKNNKIGPKDPKSNLSYVLSNAVYGLVTTTVIAKLGDSSLWDTPPVNDHLEPTESTAEMKK